ncbi:hypothetical protein LTR22_001711 [Elasticomyces elasticus]|nr:hypothetical protein LTR22_001711 [Elasticomyces elasticus]
MQFTTILMALAATTTTLTNAIVIGTIGPNILLANDYSNGVACGQKNPAVNMAIMGLCNREKSPTDHSLANNLTIGHPWPRNGVVHNGWKVSIHGPKCPGDSRWVPVEFCNAQFHSVCANGGPKGAGLGHFGANGCQEWRIFKI